MMTTALKSYFYIIVALASVVGSIIAASHISDFVGVVSSDPSPFIPDASAQSLPFTVDHHVKIKEKVADPVRIEEWMNDADRNCEMSCTYIEYQPGSHGKAGVAYITDSALDLSGAKKVHFFLMGDKGGEMVKVKIAGKNPTGAQKAENPFKEKFDKSTGVITLANDWKRYEVSLDGVNLKDVVAPFAIELLKGKTSAKQAVYFKFIVYEKEPVDQRFLLPATTEDNNSTSTLTAQDTALQANNTQGQSNEKVEGNNGSSIITADTMELDNNNINNAGNETAISSTNNAAADTSGEQISNATAIAPVAGQDDKNSAPVAMQAVDSLVVHSGDKVTLDGTLSNDPDSDQITYYWSQSDGLSVDIINADTAIPTVTIPILDKDDKITIDLVVSDGETESNKASVVIDAQYVEEIEGAKEQDLAPAGDIGGKGWSDATCGSNNENVEYATSVIINCLTDNSDGTFVSSDSPDKTTDLMFSFPQFNDPDSLSGISNSNIAYVTAQVTAKKTGASGFISFLMDDPTNIEHYTTPSISIPSDSFQKYSFTWKYNPVTGGPWTAESLNSLVAGYTHAAGQGSIQTSEFKLIVTALIVQEEQDLSPPPPPPPSSTVDEGISTVEEPAPNDGDIVIDKDAPTEDNVQDESEIDSNEREQDET